MKVLVHEDVDKSVLAGLVHDGALAVEALASLIRRAAGIAAPCSRRTIIDLVVCPMTSLVHVEGLEDATEDLLQVLIAHGDLLETTPTQLAGPGSGAVVYCAPPTFVSLDSNELLIMGVAGEQISALPAHLEDAMRHRGYRRFLQADALEELKSLGFVELPFKTWARQPPAESAQSYLGRVQKRLDGIGDPGPLDALEVLDATRPVRYYKGRWTNQIPMAGYFVARRPQKFGAPLWCVLRSTNGRPDRMLDLPTDEKAKACDEAWRLQAAIDALRGVPQVFHVRENSDGKASVLFFSPVPSWAQRRWDAVGDYSRPQGALFAYTFPRHRLDEELRVATEYLWMQMAG